MSYLRILIKDGTHTFINGTQDVLGWFVLDFFKNRRQFLKTEATAQSRVKQLDRAVCGIHGAYNHKIGRYTESLLGIRERKYKFFLIAKAFARLDK